jgi:acetyltransferase-like isoleucine patch superfamily enzyme
MFKTLKQRLLHIWIKRRHKTIISKTATVSRNCIYEGFGSINSYSWFMASFLGYGSYIANNSIIKKTIVGRFCSIGENVRTGLGLHPTNGFVSTHPAFFSLSKQAGFTFVEEQSFQEHKYVDMYKKYYVRLGNDVWIGNNVMIYDGVTIGDGAIVAAGAIVTKDVPPYSIVAGVPSKILKYRFTKDQINHLLHIRWWDWPRKKIHENTLYFKSIDEFLEKFMQSSFSISGDT